MEISCLNAFLGFTLLDLLTALCMFCAAHNLFLWLVFEWYYQ